jgi:hypothetical protein
VNLLPVDPLIHADLLILARESQIGRVHSDEVLEYSCSKLRVEARQIKRFICRDRWHESSLGPSDGVRLLSVSQFQQRSTDTESGVAFETSELRFIRVGVAW